jgi:uncharacterized protein YndB with AHSA1/START domain
MTNTNFIVVPGKQEVVITRTFDAPREVVFEACTDPKMIPQWWGPRVLTTAIERLDPTPGGLWRFIQRDPDGNEYAFHGVYHEVARPERLVFTFEFEGMPGHVMLETVTFEEQGGGTLLTDQSIYQSVGDRDGMVASGMETGSTESMERLAELLEKVHKVKSH